MASCSELLFDFIQDLSDNMDNIIRSAGTSTSLKLINLLKQIEASCPEHMKFVGPLMRRVERAMDKVKRGELGDEAINKIVKQQRKWLDQSLVDWKFYEVVDLTPPWSKE